MRNILALIGLLVVLVVCGGWYLGWYKLGSEPAADGVRKINVDVNTDKIKSDLTKSKEVVGDLLTNSNSDSQKKATVGFDTIPNVPTLPKLPAAPTVRQVEYNPDGSPKAVIVPPPTFPSGN